MSTKQSKLEHLNAIMDETCPCTLRETAINVVPGTGSANADIMFIGEAPGKKEDESGKPFVGAAGKFLDKLLASILLSRDDIYITNVVKYRPPNNRDPLPSEVSDCWSWLKEQIDIIEPKVIIPLGKHALERFIPGQQISQSHGKAFRRSIEEGGEKFVFYALYHPAAALYNGSLREILLTDFARIPKLIATEKKEHGSAIKN